MTKYFLPLLLLLGAFSLNAQNEQIDQLQQQVKTFLFKKPDSAKTYLFKLLDYSEVRHDTSVARTHSNLGITYNQLASYDSATLHFIKAIGLSKDFPHVQAQILSNLAIHYRTMAQYSKSMEALDKALALYRSFDDLNGEGLVYGEMASNFNYMAQKEKAIIYLKKAIEIFKETHDPRLYILKQKLGNAYFNNGNYSYAVEIYEDILPEFQKEKGPPYYLTLLAYGEGLIETGRIKEGESRLKEAQKGLRESNNLEYMHVAQGKLAHLYHITQRPTEAAKAFAEAYAYLRDSHSTRFLQIASDYLTFLNDKKELDRATSVIAEVKEVTDNFNIKMNAQDELQFLMEARKTFRNKNQFEASLLVDDRIDFLKDSIGNAEDRIKIAQLEESYQNEIQKEKNKILSENNALLKQYNSEQKKLTLLSFLLTLVVLILSIAIYRIHRKQLRHKKEALQQLTMTNETLKENQEIEKQLFEEKEERLQEKERELVAISLEAADTQNQIREILENNPNEKTATLRPLIENILNQRNYWNHFKTKFVEVHPQFSYNLIQMFPTLTDNDIAFCSLLKLQLNNKEIASLLGISHQSVITKKYRIKKKMDLEDDETFDQLMRDL